MILLRINVPDISSKMLKCEDDIYHIMFPSAFTSLHDNVTFEFELRKSYSAHCSSETAILVEGLREAMMAEDVAEDHFVSL